MRILLTAVIGIVATFGGPNVSAQTKITRDGTYELTLPGTDRRYTLIIPRGYLTAESVPLVVSLHFGGRVTPWIERAWRR